MVRLSTKVWSRVATSPQTRTHNGDAMRTGFRALGSTHAACAQCRTGLFHPSLVLRSAAAPASTAALNTDSFVRLGSMVLLQRALDQYAALDGSEVAREMDGEDVNRVIVTRHTFDAFCTKCHVTDADAALHALTEAAVVVPLDGGQLVHLRPVRLAEDMDTIAALGSSTQPAAESLERVSLPGSFIVRQQAEKVAELTRKEEAMRVRLQPAVAKTARWRRSVWGGSLVFAGAQLAIISRLTYFDLDWDIMEPVSYIITIGTSLFFYLFFLRHDVEHTYEQFDRHYISKRVRRYAPKDFDWDGYEALCAQLDMERATLQFLEKWAKRH